MRRYAPGAIVVTMLGIAENVNRAVIGAGLGDVPRRALPFPGRKAHRDRYVADLADLLVDYRRTGLLPRRGDSGTAVWPLADPRLEEVEALVPRDHLDRRRKHLADQSAFVLSRRERGAHTYGPRCSLGGRLHTSLSRPARAAPNRDGDRGRRSHLRHLRRPRPCGAFPTPTPVRPRPESLSDDFLDRSRFGGHGAGSRSQLGVSSA